MNNIISIVQETGGPFPGSIFAVRYKYNTFGGNNNVYYMLWSPYWQPENEPCCINIKSLEHYMVLNIRNPIIIAENISINISQIELNNLLVIKNINLKSKIKKR